MEQDRLAAYFIAGCPDTVDITHLNQPLRLHVHNNVIRQSNGMLVTDFITMHLVTSGTFYDIRTLERIRRTFPKHKTILDIGANIGNHTAFFENFLEHDRIFAFEPYQPNFQKLIRNIYHPTTVAYPVALGSQNKVVDMQPQEDANYGHVIPVEGGSVQMVRVDDLGLDDVTLMKLDVEEAELDVLRGAVETIRRCRPVVYLECARNEEPILEFFNGLGYSLSYKIWCDSLQNYEFTPSAS